MDNDTSFIVYAPYGPCVALFLADMFTVAVQSHGHGSHSHIWT